MKTLYQRISPFLRTESPKTAAEAEGKTDFICDALRKALRLGAITDGEYRQVLSRVKAYLQTHNLDPESGTVNEVAANNGWWMLLDKENRHRKMQSYRHTLLDYWCDLVDMPGLEVKT